jgi:hypothetical protein
MRIVLKYLQETLREVSTNRSMYRNSKSVKLLEICKDRVKLILQIYNVL